MLPLPEFLKCPVMGLEMRPGSPWSRAARLTLFDCRRFCPFPTLEGGKWPLVGSHGWCFAGHFFSWGRQAAAEPGQGHGFGFCRGCCEPAWQMQGPVPTSSNCKHRLCLSKERHGHGAQEEGMARQGSSSRRRARLPAAQALPALPALALTQLGRLPPSQQGCWFHIQWFHITSELATTIMTLLFPQRWKYNSQDIEKQSKINGPCRGSGWEGKGGERMSKSQQQKPCFFLQGRDGAGSGDCSTYSLPPGCRRTGSFPETAGIRHSKIVIQERRVLGGGAGLVLTVLLAC